MYKNKNKILLLALTFAAFANIKPAYAAEEVINYDYESLDQLFAAENEADLIEEETVPLEAENFEAKGHFTVNDLPVVYYDNRPIDRLLDPTYKEEAFNDSKETKDPATAISATIKDGIIYENGKKASSKWVKVGDDTYFAGADGVATKGLNKLAGKDYFFDKNARLVKNETLILDGGKYQADSDGSLSLLSKAAPGWARVDEKAYYYDNAGKLLRGMQDLGESRYFFDMADGLLVRNQIIKDGADRIHTAQDGKAHYIGWDYHNGKLGYFTENGNYTTGLAKIGDRTYGFDENGKIYNRQNKKINGQWYYFNKYGEASKADGNFKTGWVGNRYYFSDGKPAEGLQVIDGKTYIFHELTLEKQRSTEKVFNHKRYKLDNTGVATFMGDVAKVPARAGTQGQFKAGFSKDLNRKTPYFTQNDPRWKNNRYASGSFGGYGCGPTAMAMVLNRKLNRNDIYPTTTAVDARPYVSYNGTDWQYLIEGPEVYGLKAYEVPVNEKAFIQALKNNPIIVRVGNGYFINAGHYMVVDSYRDGKFIINDPFYSQKNTLEAHDFWRLRQEVTVAWEIK